ncbi:uncharacterized protein LOC131957304 [Physella acuta]|uniref:uncharacterized protein LOC131957304 n=1 Tax=Physella acuta TaxID=109671 RepID=UPI0027DBC7E6|nr:uncharacterized protein LOC131957304 [Physella acuta]XP_059178016.1 uncharacterized protein LOC131957304 [Physella acuta]
MVFERLYLRLSRHLSTIIFVSVFVVSTTFILTVVQRHLRGQGPQLDLLPFNQMERAHASREITLAQAKQNLDIYWAQKSKGVSANNRCKDVLSQDMCTNVERDILIIKAMFYPHTPNKDGLRFLDEPSLGDHYQITIPPYAKNMTEKQLSQQVCYKSISTRNDPQHKPDSTFCPRLTSLMGYIYKEVEPPLVVLYTWWPDPLVDKDKLNRKLVFENYNMLRPFVKPVIFTDSRVVMATANIYDWACLPVPEYNQEGVPVFKSMSREIVKNFNGTFYAYARATTVFDVTFLETLLAVKDKLVSNILEEKKSGEWYQIRRDYKKPVLIYGNAMAYAKLGSVRDLLELNAVAYSKGNLTWDDPKKGLVYFAYRNIEFEDLPNVIVDDVYLTPFLVARSRRLGHVVLETTLTTLAVYTEKNTTVTDWGRSFIKTKPRDPLYNKRLAETYLTSMKGFGKASSLVGGYTKFSPKDGSVLINGNTY